MSGSGDPRDKYFTDDFETLETPDWETAKEIDNLIRQFVDEGGRMSKSELMKIYATVAAMGAADLVRNHPEVTMGHASGILRRTVAERAKLEQLSEQAWHLMHRGEGPDVVEQAEKMADGPLERGQIQLMLWAAAAMHHQQISYEDIHDHHLLVADTLDASGIDGTA